MGEWGDHVTLQAAADRVSWKFLFCVLTSIGGIYMVSLWVCNTAFELRFNGTVEVAQKKNEDVLMQYYDTLWFGTLHTR